METYPLWPTTSWAKSDSLQDKRSRDIMEYLSPYLTTNATTRVNLVYDASLRMMQKYFDLGIKFKHIDPQLYQLWHVLHHRRCSKLYQMEVRLFQQKLSMNGSYGIQVNNLKNVRKKYFTRNIMNLNASIMPATNAGFTIDVFQLLYRSDTGLCRGQWFSVWCSKRRYESLPPLPDDGQN